MLFVWFHSFLSLRVFSTKLSSVLALRRKEARMTTKMRANWRNGSRTNEKVQSSTSSFPCVRMRTSEVRGAHRTGINGNIEMKMYSDKHTHPRIYVCVCGYRDIISVFCLFTIKHDAIFVCMAEN